MSTTQNLIDAAYSALAALGDMVRESAGVDDREDQAPDDVTEAYQELKSALAAIEKDPTTRRTATPPAPRLVVHVKGGLVQSIYSDSASIPYILADEDDADHHTLHGETHSLDKYGPWDSTTNFAPTIVATIFAAANQAQVIEAIRAH